MASLRLPPDLEERLNVLSRTTNRSKSYYLKKALASFLEDQEDYLLALSRFEDKKISISLDDVKKNLGLSLDEQK